MSDPQLGVSEKWRGSSMVRRPVAPRRIHLVLVNRPRCMMCCVVGVTLGFLALLAFADLKITVAFNPFYDQSHLTTRQHFAFLALKARWATVISGVNDERIATRSKPLDTLTVIYESQDDLSVLDAAKLISVRNDYELQIASIGLGRMVYVACHSKRCQRLRANDVSRNTHYHRRSRRSERGAVHCRGCGETNGFDMVPNAH